MCGNNERRAVEIGKGSGRRPRQISLEENDLRWDLKEGKISLRTFNRRLKKIKG